MDCIFCKIASGEVPAQVVYEDTVSIAFKDANPATPVHILVVPTKHADSLADTGDLTEAEMGHLLKVAAHVATDAGVGDDFRLMINTGEGAGQSVFHLHVHVLGGQRMGRLIG